MRVLLTRAKEDAARSAASLAALGHESIVSPVIEIIGLPAKLPAQQVDAVVATSAHAFASVDVRELSYTPLYVVGERTREAARRVGWNAPIHVSENAKALIVFLRVDSPDTRSVLYLAGDHRKPDIEAAAREIGLGLEVVETYVAREILSLSEESERALRAGALDGVLHYSRRSAELFIALTQRAELWVEAAKLRHFALSPDVAEPLATAGARIHVAAHPDEDHLFALLTDADRG
ncbi:MAG: uroporphyrinogen-III synthase [Methylobacteriaceae bacterium]|nr:uroporphyrinogen-III synthase [Methylobacteriaceae bacterium]